jgi:hypothetical protein
MLGSGNRCSSLPLRSISWGSIEYVKASVSEVFRGLVQMETGTVLIRIRLSLQL